MEPIAIIGIGCRFPGGVDTPDAFWQLLIDRVDAITDISDERLRIEALNYPELLKQGRIVTQQGGFLKHVDQFDPAFFNISPREAVYLDPQQRLLLETAWEALEDAGLVPERLAGSQTGVFIGVWTNDYQDYMFSGSPDIEFYMTTGGGRYAASGRLSYSFNFNGPSLTIDTACSSSLVAVHLACQSLWNNECVLALAGGANLILQPQITVGYSQAKLLAPDGRCKFGDAAANGYVRSEGVGMIVLKPLSHALSDNDPICAIIRSTVVNNDGQSSGLLITPSQQGQETLLREAYRRAGIFPEQVHYVEVHGTGTSVGDPVEVQALGAVLGEHRLKDNPCIIGSVKTNIGHTEAAAGIAGLIKVVLCLKHRMIPPSLHFNNPNPVIPWQELPVVVQQELSSWPVDDCLAIAGVSSFGITGTNAHVVLEEIPRQQAANVPTTDHPAGQSYLLPLSARTPAALQAVVQAYDAFLASDAAATLTLPDLCYTASLRRTHHDHRLTLVTASLPELRTHLAALVAGTHPPRAAFGHRSPGPPPKLVFVFPGQGGQWLGMGRHLLATAPVFRQALEACEAALSAYVPWSLLDELTAPPERSRLDDIAVLQPMLFALQVGLAALWRSWGIEPVAVVGHSLGEVAAAHVAGALTLADAAAIICRRSQLLRQLRGQGAMLSVELGAAEASRLLETGAEQVAVAAINGPRTTVLAGEPAALTALGAQLTRQGVFWRWVQVDVAAHSPQVDKLCPELAAALVDVRPEVAAVPLYSTVRSGVSDGRDLDGAYWVENLRAPVRFWEAVAALGAAGHTLFVELSPHPTLGVAIAQGLGELGQEGQVFGSLRREEQDRGTLLETLGGLYVVGYPIEWRKCLAESGACVRLPTYPWQRERFWIDNQGVNSSQSLHEASTNQKRWHNHPFLGEQFEFSAQSGIYIWQMDISTVLFPFLSEHSVQGTVVVPAAIYLELILSAAATVFDSEAYVLEHVEFKTMLSLPTERPQTVQLIITLELPGVAAFQFFSRSMSTAKQVEPWTLHATGTLLFNLEVPPAEQPVKLTDIQKQGWETISHAEYYTTMQRHGLHYGSPWKGVAQCWWRGHEAIARLELASGVGVNADKFLVHPALLDACLQVLVLVALETDVATTSENDVFLPISVGRLQIYRYPGSELWSHALLRPGTPADMTIIQGDVFLLDAEGVPVLSLHDVRFQRLAPHLQQTDQSNVRDLLYSLEWKALPRSLYQPLGEMRPPQSGRWLIFADTRGVGKVIAAQLEAIGETCVMISKATAYRMTEPSRYQINPIQPDNFAHLIADLRACDDSPYHGVLYLWSLDSPEPDEADQDVLNVAQQSDWLSVIYLLQALIAAGWSDMPRLCLVTCGVYVIGQEDHSVSVAQAPFWGLGRTIVHEHPELRCIRVDLSAADPWQDIAILIQLLWANDQEDEIALRSGVAYVPRLVKWRPEADPAAGSPSKLDQSNPPAPADNQAFRLEITTPGMLDQLTLRAMTRQAPGPKEVEIQIEAAGLNFKDVLAALDNLPGAGSGGRRLGLECAGIITALGADVTEFQIGDEVMAVAHNSFATHTVVDARLVVHKPTRLSFEEAASVPIVFLTAYYALHHVGRLSKDERILIHAAAGGVGLAAIQLAQRADAEVFATAGSSEKREFLRSLDLQCVMDSRSLAFADEVLARTNGKGVDVVLNSLAGAFITKSLATLGAYGRFLEIGRRDVYQNTQIGLAPFQKNLSFSVIDLDHMCQERPSLVGSLLRELVALLTNGSLKPLPLQVFPISDILSAFRYMAQAKHIGKIVISLQNKQTALVAPSSAAPMLFHSNATYLISGGLGGLGLTFAQWLVRRGARHLVLLGRQRPTAEQQAQVAQLVQAGAEVLVLPVDVAEAAQVAQVLARVRGEWPPLRGVIHAAGVLADRTLRELDEAELRAVMLPKVSGAWQLHVQTQADELDFFVLCSSVTALLGTPGQANYAAANAFLDGLAHARRVQGLAGLSVNWGPWAEVGMAVADNIRGERLALRGIGSLTPEQGLDVLEILLSKDVAQVGVMPFNVQQWCTYNPTAVHTSLLTELQSHDRRASKPKQGMRETLLALEPSRRRSFFEHYLNEQIARVVRLAPSQINHDVPLRTLGIDSLMTLELRNHLEADLRMKLSAATIWNYPTIARLAAYLIEEMGISLDAQITAHQTSQEEAAELSSTLKELEQLSEHEVEALLLKELDDIHRDIDTKRYV